MNPGRLQGSNVSFDHRDENYSALKVRSQSLATELQQVNQKLTRRSGIQNHNVK